MQKVIVQKHILYLFYLLGNVFFLCKMLPFIFFSRTYFFRQEIKCVYRIQYVNIQKRLKKVNKSVEIVKHIKTTGSLLIADLHYILKQ